MLVYKKNLIFLKTDIYKHSCWLYIRKLKLNQFIGSLGGRFQ